MERSMTSSYKEKSTCKSVLQVNDLILIKLSGYRSHRIILPRGEYFLQAKNEQVFKNKRWFCHLARSFSIALGEGRGYSHSRPTQTPACGHPASARRARCHCRHFQLRTLSCELLCASLKDADELTR